MPQIAFKPDWTRHTNATPFKHNDRMLGVLPFRVIIFPGSGISANLVGIPVWKFGEGGT